jgi:spore germination cell wall hydrolase CwlJ-like protein
MRKGCVAVLSAILVFWSTATANLSIPIITYLSSPAAVNFKPVKISSVRQQHCLAKAIYFEARNQSQEGKVGVATVVLNRLKWWKKYNDTCDVVFDGCNFSWVCQLKVPRKPFDTTGIEEDQAWQETLELARTTMIQYNKKGFKDVTHGATYFHGITIEPPYWVGTEIIRSVRIDDHIFYKRL